MTEHLETGSELAPNAAVLEVTDLRVSFRTRGRRSGRFYAVDGVDLTVANGETLALVGESGCGKSTTGRAILRLVDGVEGSIKCRGDEVAHLSQREFRPMRRRMQMVFQDPYSSLNPSRTVGDTIREPLKFHLDMSDDEVDRRVGELIDVIGLPAESVSRYPHEFSGGQRQRIAIARAIAVRPDLVICDEAVSALDVSTQNQILRLLTSLRSEFGCSYLFISHDLSVVRQIADRVAVMYLGQIVEQGPVDSVFDNPRHPYTKALLAAVPVVRRDRLGRRPTVLRGDLPDPASPPPACRFVTRCPIAEAVCHEIAPVMTIDGSTGFRCHVAARVASAAPTEGESHARA